MKRFIDQKLIEWQSRLRRKPLLLRGARQVGKTHSVEKFGRDNFKNLAVVNLERNPDWHRVFIDNFDARRITADLEILLRQKIVPGDTLLFIDEIQSCPQAIIALRYFYEELPDLHVIAAGSLLEFALKDIPVPVGRIQFLNVHPLSFAEYLYATGNNQAAKTVLDRPEAVSPTVHEFLINELRRFFFIGGMPESVLAYIKTGSIQESFDVHAEICETYRLDFAKYSPQTDKHCLNTILTTVAQSVGQQIKYARLGTGYSNPTLKKAFDLLCLAGIIRKVPSVDPSGLPLGVRASDKIFKTLMVDIGLMRYLTGMPVDVEYTRTDLLDIYRGAVAEQFVGQELVLSQHGEVYYWSRPAKSSSAEVDYVAAIKGEIYPLEVKSGATGRLKSLQLFLKTYGKTPSGMVFSTRPYEALPERGITYIPLYFAYSATGGAGKL
jgi:uncharacterized protein